MLLKLMVRSCTDLGVAASISKILGDFKDEDVQKKGISQAKPSYKKRAIKFTQNIEVEGMTPISDAVEHAFKKVVQRNNIDTIYLLSDGAPTKPAAEVR